MNNPLGDFTDEFVELGEDTGKKLVRDVVKGIPQTIKQQLTRPMTDEDKKTDPTTGKPVPTKKILTQLTQATAQLQQTKLKKIREELDKQRLKVTDEKQKLAPIESKKTAGQGPIMPESAETDKAPQPDAVAATMRNSKSTGEFGRQVGG